PVTGTADNGRHRRVTERVGGRPATAPPVTVLADHTADTAEQCEEDDGCSQCGRKGTEPAAQVHQEEQGTTGGPTRQGQAPRPDHRCRGHGCEGATTLQRHVYRSQSNRMTPAPRGAVSSSMQRSALGRIRGCP